MTPPNVSAAAITPDKSVAEEQGPARKKRRTKKRKSAAVVIDSDSDGEGDLPIGGPSNIVVPSSPPFSVARVNGARSPSSDILALSSPARGDFTATPSREYLQDFMSSNWKRIRAAIGNALAVDNGIRADGHAAGGEKKEAVLPSSPLVRKVKGKKRALSPPPQTGSMRAAKNLRATQKVWSAADPTHTALSYSNRRKAAREAADAVRLAQWQTEKLAQEKKDRELVSKRKAIGYETEFHIKKAVEEEKHHLILVFGNSGSDGRLPGKWNLRRATWGRRGEADRMRSKNRRA